MSLEMHGREIRRKDVAAEDSAVALVGDAKTLVVFANRCLQAAAGDARAALEVEAVLRDLKGSEKDIKAVEDRLNGTNGRGSIRVSLVSAAGARVASAIRCLEVARGRDVEETRSDVVPASIIDDLKDIERRLGALQNAGVRP